MGFPNISLEVFGFPQEFSCEFHCKYLYKIIGKEEQASEQISKILWQICCNCSEPYLVYMQSGRFIYRTKNSLLIYLSVRLIIMVLKHYSTHFFAT
jgi:hypothetical protein